MECLKDFYLAGREMNTGLGLSLVKRQPSLSLADPLCSCSMVLSLPSFKEGHYGISSERVYIPQALFLFIGNITTYPPTAR